MKNLDNLKHWINEKAPDVLVNMNGPASDSDIETLEVETGIELPEEFKHFLRLHNGEQGSTTSFFGDCHDLLSCEHILELYNYQRNNLEHSYDDLTQLLEWKELAVASRILVKGPVKPHEFHSRWLPITAMGRDVCRYIDFDPAEGGTPGQIIEVDVTSAYWQLIATSFHDLIEQYWTDVSEGKYEIAEHGCIELKEEYWEGSDSWGVPQWLLNASEKEVEKSKYKFEDWHLGLAYSQADKDFLESEFPKELSVESWYDYKPSKIDSDYYEFTGSTENEVMFIAFSKISSFKDIAKQINKTSRKKRPVELRITVKKHSSAIDKKSHPRWRCWLEVTEVEYLASEESVKPFWKFW